MTSTRVKRIVAGKNEDRVVYEWANGLRMKLDRRGYSMYQADDLLFDCRVYCDCDSDDG